MTPAGTVDEVATRRLLERSQGVSFTFHRAFDQSQNPLEDMETKRYNRLFLVSQLPTDLTRSKEAERLRAELHAL